jgi:hypothetical protein
MSRHSIVCNYFPNTYTLNNQTMAPRRQTTNYPTLPKLCLGPGDSFVADYEDPRRLLGSNLPSGLKKIIADRLIDKTDSDSESELDVGDTSNNSGNESGSGSDTDTSERSRRRTRERSNSRAREEVIVREDKRYYGDDLYSGRKRRIKEPFRISCLAFGSRVGDFAMISCKNGEYYLG